MSSETTNKFGIIDLSEVPDSVDNAIKNLTNEPTANMGKTFGDIWFLVFGSISQLADKRRMKYAKELENFNAELSNSISKIPAEKKLEPSIQITAQALENSKYCIEEKELRQMFTALITNSMNIDFKADAHPSFAEMIKQMSPLDAEILKIFKNGPKNGFPLCDYRLELIDGGYVTLADQIFLEGSLLDTSSCSLALTSLERFGLLSIPPGTSLRDDSFYKKFEEHPLYQYFQDCYPENKITINRGKVALTILGHSFVKVCIPD